MTTFLSLTPGATTSELHVVCHASSRLRPMSRRSPACGRPGRSTLRPDTQTAAARTRRDSSSLVMTPPTRFVNENDPHVSPSGAVPSFTCWPCGAHAYEQSSTRLVRRLLDDRARVRIRVVVLVVVPLLLERPDDVRVGRADAGRRRRPVDELERRREPTSRRRGCRRCRRRCSSGPRPRRSPASRRWR